MSAEHESQGGVEWHKPVATETIEDALADRRGTHTMEEHTAMPALDAASPGSLREAHEALRIAR